MHPVGLQPRRRRQSPPALRCPLALLDGRQRHGCRGARAALWTEGSDVETGWGRRLALSVCPQQADRRHTVHTVPAGCFTSRVTIALHRKEFSLTLGSALAIGGLVYRAGSPWRARPRPGRWPEPGGSPRTCRGSRSSLSAFSGVLWQARRVVGPMGWPGCSARWTPWGWRATRPRWRWSVRRWTAVRPPAVRRRYFPPGGGAATRPLDEASGAWWSPWPRRSPARRSTRSSTP